MKISLTMHRCRAETLLTIVMVHIATARVKCDDDKRLMTNAWNKIVRKKSYHKSIESTSVQNTISQYKHSHSIWIWSYLDKHANGQVRVIVFQPTFSAIAFPVTNHYGHFKYTVHLLCLTHASWQTNVQTARGRRKD